MSAVFMKTCTAAHNLTTLMIIAESVWCFPGQKKNYKINVFTYLNFRTVCGGLILVGTGVVPSREDPGQIIGKK